MIGTSETTGPAAEQMEPSLPGTKFFAPQARFVDADSGEPILIGDQPVHADLVSARVTQTHHGVSQVSLTLNNQRHEEAAPYRPLVPTWKYNDLNSIKFGQQIRVQFRYGTDDWMPMILARITDIAFSFPSSGGAQMTVQGEDRLSLLKAKPNEDKRYRDMHELEMVEDVLTRSGTGLALASAIRLPFQEPLRTITHQKTQTYLQFIESLAERMDYEVFVDFEDSTNNNSPVQFHFEPARSTVLDGIVELTWNKDLVDFKPRLKVWDIRTEATAEGRHPRQRQRIEESASEDEVDNDLHTAPGGATPINAIAARALYYSNENGPESNAAPLNASNLDAERARMMAAAALRKSARQFLTAEASTIGFTRIRPGIHINIKKLDAPFDGIYYVTKVVHSIDSGGFKTQCSLRRPGMLDPAGYPGG